MHAQNDVYMYIITKMTVSQALCSIVNKKLENLRVAGY